MKQIVNNKSDIKNMLILFTEASKSKVWRSRPAHNTQLDHSVISHRGSCVYYQLLRLGSDCAVTASDQLSQFMGKQNRWRREEGKINIFLVLVFSWNKQMTHSTHQVTITFILKPTLPRKKQSVNLLAWKGNFKYCLIFNFHLLYVHRSTLHWL